MNVSELYTAKTKRSGVYNITPIENIPTIMEKGILSNSKAVRINHRSVAMQEVQDIRDHIKVPGGLLLHDYANLYFDPRNPMMYKKRNLAENLCVLKIKLDILDLVNVVVSDCNASSSYARFYNPREGIDKLDFKTIFMHDWTSADQITEWRQKSMKCAEILVPNVIPYEYVLGAFVVNETAKEKMLEIGFDKRIVIKSEVYFRG